MRLRNPLTAAVVGALLIGGAATGATGASWVDQVNVQANSVNSGTMGVGASASPGSMTVQRGGSATVRVTVNDTSSTAAKNLEQRVTPSVTGPLPSGITASLTTVDGGSCTGTTQGPVDLTPGGSFTSCLTVAVSSGSSASSTTVNVGVSGAQVRGGTVSGWTTPTQTVSVPVSVPSVVDTPAIRCDTQVGTDAYSFEWSAVAGATSYRIYQADAADGPWPTGPIAVGSGLSHTATLPPGINATRYYRVTGVNAGGESSLSNVVMIRRNGTSHNLTCEV